MFPVNKLWFLFLPLLFLSSRVQGQAKVSNIEFIGLEKTRERVVLNELEFEQGALLDTTALDSLLDFHCTKLYNLQLFHWVKSDYNINHQSNDIEVVFTFQERWYLWPVPIFSLADRNFNAWWQKKDFKRIDYGLHLVHYNFRGANEKLKSNIQEGFNKKYELFYTIPYINKAQNIGIEAAVSLSRSHFADYGISQGKILFKEFEDFPVQRVYTRTGAFYRPSVLSQIYIRNELNQFKISDSLNIYNGQYLDSSRNVFFDKVELEYLLNKRKTFSYPERGYYLNLLLSLRLGISNKQLTQWKAYLKAAKYSRVASRVFLANSIDGGCQYQNQYFFFDQQALGYKQFVRGYEYYVVNGTSYFLLKNTLKYKLLGNKEIKLKFLSSEKFNTVPVSLYAGIHGDMGFVDDYWDRNENILANKLLIGYGAGIHLVTYYDRVFVFEYSINKMGEKGFFISAKFPI